MIFLNHLESRETVHPDHMKTLVTLLAPFAPHVCDEIWAEMKGKKTVYFAPWPEYDKKKLVSDTVKMAVQVNGKVRTIIEVAANAKEDKVKEKALQHKDIVKWTEGKEIRKVIYIKGKIVNIVAV